jgi:hypothetical protein
MTIYRIVRETAFKEHDTKSKREAEKIAKLLNKHEQEKAEIMDWNIVDWYVVREINERSRSR